MNPTFDRKHGTTSVMVTKPTKHAVLGVSFHRQAGPVVAGISEDGLLVGSGLEAGMQVIQVNGMNCSHSAEFCTMLLQNIVGDVTIVALGKGGSIKTMDNSSSTDTRSSSEGLSEPDEAPEGCQAEEAQTNQIHDSRRSERKSQGRATVRFENVNTELNQKPESTPNTVKSESTPEGKDASTPVASRRDDDNHIAHREPFVERHNNNHNSSSSKCKSTIVLSSKGFAYYGPNDNKKVKKMCWQNLEKQCINAAHRPRALLKLLHKKGTSYQFEMANRDDLRDIRKDIYHHLSQHHQRRQAAPQGGACFDDSFTSYGTYN
ncbi:unknown protein [Seminavis robusta]|uniref:PDZ domain-containing protein n=1 Tax=Seminavis robusta TaxID=568900 RepID=A0A9N8F350_9STRA|nr:unknown protein [Seminavis robusta]|eukprot:Sro3270_g346060.1 n/a (319) ;mRNA; f:924-1933